ncbi:MAG: hypothetical protein GY791_21120 [Alphaproteobacteria bacterium]|nr:hypothetical protein [Alphaproteobacteria bacterium]
MRMMFRFTIPVEKGNAAISDGSLAEAIEALLAEHKPEAAYFLVDQGKRAGMVFIDIADPAELAHINEPLFAKLDAAIEIMPVLTAEDLRRGLP